MKCPKCGYIGFEQTDRCRNCGYDFVLAPSAPPDPDLPLRKGDAGPFGDFDLGEAGPPAAADGSRGSRRRYDPDLDPRITPQARTAADLPLFEEAGAEELPIVPTSAPTPPLAVRRSTPPAVRTRPRPTPRFTEPAPETRLPLADAPAAFARPGEPEEDATAAPGLGERFFAAFVDWVLLLGIDGVVVYFTLQICRLDLSQISVLPLPPLAVFLVLLNGGYLALMTAAGGQTLGKMAFGLKVVRDDDGSVPVGRAIARSLLLLACALPAGVGLLPIVFASGHRGLHDQLAGTRVLRIRHS